MNILFVYSLHDSRNPITPLGAQYDIHLGISYISSLLRNHGHQTKLLVLNNKNAGIIFDALKAFRPQLICFTAVATEYPFIASIANLVKRRKPHIFLLAGGTHVSLNPEECLSDSFDGVCIGEGEHPTLELVHQIETGKLPLGIANLWIKNDGGIEKNSPRSFLQDIDCLPFPDREIWQEWITTIESTPAVLLGRGCPFNCTYCCNHALRNLASGAYVRLRSYDNIIQEMGNIIDTFPSIKDIYLEVETFGIDVKWAIELCSRLEEFNEIQKVPLSIGTNLRIIPNADFESLFVAMKRCNFRYINIGLESGSERVRREILNRRESNQDIINAARLAKHYGLKVCFYNMVGIPGETIEDFNQTVEMNRLCLPEENSNSIFYPYPGTQLYSICKEKGFMAQSVNPDLERQKARLDLPGFSRRQIEKKYVWFDYYVYKGHKPIAEIMASVLGRMLSSSPFLKHLYEWTNYDIPKRTKRLLKSVAMKLAR